MNLIFGPYTLVEHHGSVVGPDGPVALADFDVHAIADAPERLLDDQDEWRRRSQLGLDFVSAHSWDAAAEQVERELRNALRVREPATTTQLADASSGEP